jgi:hypothetical protein
LSRSDPFAVPRKSSIDGRFDLSGYSDEEFGNSTVYLFPVLIGCMVNVASCF